MYPWEIWWHGKTHTVCLLPCCMGFVIQHGFCHAIASLTLGERCWVKFHFLVGVESHHINMPIIKFPANFTFSFCWSQHRRPTHFSDVKITNKSMEIMTNMEFLVSRKFCTSDVGDWSISPAGTPGMKGTCEATKILFNFHFFFFSHFLLTYFVFSSHFLFFYCTLTRIASIFCLVLGHY